MKIILIGFMGSGKSSVSKELGNLLDIPVIEMDEMILERSPRATIAEVFQFDGESTFREKEREVAREIATRQTAVVSTGGGVIQNDDCLDALRTGKALVIFLETQFETVCSRLADTADRPLLADRERARTLFCERADLYRRGADVIIQTDEKSISEVALEIQKAVKGRL